MGGFGVGDFINPNRLIERGLGGLGVNQDVARRIGDPLGLDDAFDGGFAGPRDGDMNSKGGGSGNGTQVVRTEPSAIVAPHLYDLLGNADYRYNRQRSAGNQMSAEGLRTNEIIPQFEALFNRSIGNAARDYGLDQTGLLTGVGMQVSPFTPEQQEAQAMQLALGRRGVDPAYQQAVRTASGLQQQPLTAEQRAAAGMFGNLAGSDPFQAQSGVAANRLASTARGANLGNNPHLDSMYGRASDRVLDDFERRVLPGISAQFAASGRYGSDAMQGEKGRSAEIVGDTLSNMATDIYGGDYARERGFQEQAAGSLSGLYGQGSARQLASAEGLGGLGSDSSKQALAAASLTPSLADQAFGADLRRSQVVGDVGNQYQTLMNQIVDRTGQGYDARIGNDWELMQRYGNLLSGVPIGQEQTTLGQNTNGGSRTSSAIGSGLSGAAMGSTFGPWGAAIGGIAGLGLGYLGGR